MLNIAVDTETYYDDACNVAELGPYAYCRHPEWSCYLVSISSEDGYRFVGPPEKVEWERINGHRWLMANAAFDLEVIDRLKELGICPAHLAPGDVSDVLDLSRYLQQPGNLKDAVAQMLGKSMDKAIRTSMKGKVLMDLPEEKRTAVLEYAQRDADLTLELWQKFHEQWPAWEQRLSTINRDMGRKGLPVDKDLLDEHYRNLSTLLWNTREKIPWDEPILSEIQVHKYCREQGISAPISMAKTSVDFENWLAKHGDSHPAIRALSEYRRINTLLERVRTMILRTREDGTVPVGQKYCGATATRRFSMDGGINFQNMSREALFGVDIRKTITAPHGFLWAVVDATSIEPAVGAVLCRDKDLQDFLRDGGDVYERCARAMGDYADPRPLKEVDKGLRQRNKPIRLGGEYGQGARGLKDYAKTYGVEMSLEEATEYTRKFRENHPKIVNQWRLLENGIRRSCGTPVFSVKLPSGNTLEYRKPVLKKPADSNFPTVMATVVRGSKPVEGRVWGSAIHQHCCQATARDVLCWYLMTLVDTEKIDVRLTVHDEIVALVPEETAEECLGRIVRVMSTPPPWMPSLPAKAEGFLTKQYGKG